jgi:repressor LexA
MKPPYTPRQGQFLAFIHHYTTLHGRPPAEAEMADFFRVTPPSVHLMVLTLERRGFITRVPGQARSIALRLPPEALPPLQAVGVGAVIPPPPPAPGLAGTGNDELAFLRLGKRQLEDLFAYHARNPLGESGTVQLLDVLVESFAHAGLGARLVHDLCRHACTLYHHHCRVNLPRHTFEQSVELLFKYLPESSRRRWREALSSGAVALFNADQ